MKFQVPDFNMMFLERKTVIFDLDETLAHCVTQNIEKADHIITVKLNSGQTVKVKSIDFILNRLVLILDHKP